MASIDSGCNQTAIPFVSVLMTAYNREKFIAEAIESVLNSEYLNFELIVVDDASNDKTVEIVKRYATIDHRVHLYRNERNLGDYPNRNRAAKYAKGKYLVTVDSDDTMYPGVLEKWVREMETHQARFGIFSHLGNLEPTVLSSEEVLKTHFFHRPILSFGPCATIVLRSYFLEKMQYPEKYGPANDMYHHIKLAASTPVLFFPFPLVNYRLHELQEKNNTYSYLYNNYRYLRDALVEIPLPLLKKDIRYLSKKNKRRFVINLVKFWLETRDWKRTAKAVQYAQFSINDFLTGLLHI